MINRVVCVLAVALFATSARGVSFGIDGHAVIYEHGGQVCFRVERYVFSHSVLSFLERSRGIDERDVRLVDILVGDDKGHWGVYKDPASPGLRLRKSTGVCYGAAPVGYVTTDEAEPLAAGRYTVLMNAREGERALRFTDDFCVSASKHVIECDTGQQAPRSFLKLVLSRILGD